MQELPDGVVTFLFTDVEGSTRLWEEAPDAMGSALRIHDAAITEAVEAFGGVPVKPRGEGDSQFVVFRSAIDAVGGSVEIQRRLAEVDWPTPRPLRVRASLHTGAADLVLGDYYGPAGWMGIGGYPAKTRSSRSSYHLETAARLWTLSEELTGVRYLEPPR